MDERSETIGSVLAQARRSAGLTVGQLSSRTRIREALIHAIERDDFSQCGGDFYARGHVRSVARALGLDPEGMVQVYDHSHGGAPRPVRAAAVFQADNPIKLRERRSMNWTMAMVIALAILVVFGVARLLGGAGDMQVADVQPAVPKPSARGQAAPLPNQAAAPPVQAADLVVVQVKANDESKVTVRDAKGRKMFGGVMRAGKTSTWKAKSEIRLTIHNAGAVNLKVNGKDLGVPGRTGEKVRRTFGPTTPRPR